MLTLIVRPVEVIDKKWLVSLLKAQFGSEKIALRSKVVNALDYPGFIAQIENENVGVLIYDVQTQIIEIIALISIRPKMGVGTNLVQKVISLAMTQQKKFVNAITTNDNTQTLRFYQKNGFRMTQLFLESVKDLRKIKPEIPDLGNDGIPIRDEIELKFQLK